jgi:geranylgeranyl pyrophosphate synthase
MGYMQRCQSRVNARMTDWLSRLPHDAPRLVEAMRYAVLIGGKRLRPLLAYASAEAAGAPVDVADDAACALELLHTYSLVHDDLPAMDDDALRRGKPTCHIAFDEATAILAGDALQCLAFEILAEGSSALAPHTRLAMIHTLAQASGTGGMAGGQALDLEAEGQALSLAALEQIHRLKTGRLIRAAVRMGALAGGLPAEGLGPLDRYADAIGLAFQVQDDILDVIGHTDVLGKPRGSDEALAKATYPRLLGLESARTLALRLRDEALDALESFNAKADPLRSLAHFIVQRNH